MSERIVYYGEINNELNKKLIEKAQNYISNNRSEDFYYILPSGNLLTKYRENLLKEFKGAINLNVITFDDIVEKLVNKRLYKKINDGFKEIILTNIVDKLYKEEKLSYYENQIGNEAFIKSLSYIIGEIKRSIITPENFKEGMIDKDKYEEIYYIYFEYQKFLENNNLLDTEEVFIKALDSLKNKTNIFDGLETIIIDGFFDFRSQELEIIESLSKRDINIHINIPYKFKRKFKTVEETLLFLKNIGFKTEVIDNENKGYFDKLSNLLFYNSKELLEKNKRLNLIKADNKSLEIRRIASEIKEILKAGHSADDIAIITNNLDEYRDIINEEFENCKIPISINKEINMEHSPIIKGILNIINLRKNNFDIESIINHIKSPYFYVNIDIDRDRLEFILYEIKNKYKDNNILNSLENEIKQLEFLKGATSDETLEKRIEELYKLKKIIKKIIEDISKIPLKSTPEDIVMVINNIVYDYEIEKNIKSLYDIHNDEDIYYRDMRSLDKLQDIFEQIINIFNLTEQGNVKIKEFNNILKILIDKEKIIISYGNRRGVNILTPSTSRGLLFNETYIIGLKEGNYPKIIKNNWFFNETAQEMFLNIGMNINTYEKAYDKETLLFLIALTRGHRKVTLSYSDGYNKNTSIPSVFIDALLSKFRGNSINDKINYEDLNIEYKLKDDLKYSLDTKELIRSLMYKHFNDEDISTPISMYNTIEDDTIKQIYEKIKVEKMRYSNSFNKYDGKLKDNIVVEDINNNMNDIFSISQLETYAECPMKYYFKYILKIKPIEKKEEFSSIEKGNIYHQVLAEFYTRYKQSIYGIINGKISTIEDINEKVSSIMDMALKNEGIIPKSDMWNIRLKFMVDKLVNLISKDINRLKEKKMYPLFFEYKFGYKGDFQINIGDNKIKLLGKIDRIDGNDSEFIIYDYKTSYGKKIKDILKGTSLQLPVYLMAIQNKNLNPFAAGYITIKDGKYSYPIVKKEYKELVNEKKGLNIDEWNDIINKTKNNIIKYVNGIKRGDFRVSPTNCSPYCPYQDICRYDKERISKKEGEYATY